MRDEKCLNLFVLTVKFILFTAYSRFKQQKLTQRPFRDRHSYIPCKLNSVFCCITQYFGK